MLQNNEAFAFLPGFLAVIVKQSASVAWISCAKEQPSRWHCLASSNQCGANTMMVAHWHIKSMLIASKAAFLKKVLAVSTWILIGSSIECHKKNHQPFSLSCVRFGSQAILISG